MFETDRLPTALIEEFKKRLAAEGVDVHRVDAPRQHLEALFLEIVRSAQSEGAVTSGARETGEIPAFLGRGPSPSHSTAPLALTQGSPKRAVVTKGEEVTEDEEHPQA